MKYLSVCSGIEAATVAWHHLGWEPVGFSEIEKFPSQVLQHHYPNVPNLGDMTKFKEWNIERPDLLVGGTPCQSFSVAGLRKGLEDPRGNLALVYCGILNHYRPTWFVWENVPGVLSSAGGRDFGSFLGAVAKLGYGFAYRVLDAQYWGVAQRRKRVFVVGYLGDWRPAAAVLFESKSLSRDTKPSRETGEENSKCLTRGIGQRYDSETETMIPVTYDLYNVTAPVNGQNRKAGDPCHTLARSNTEHAAVDSIQGNLIGREIGGPQGVGASDDDVMYTLTKADVHGVTQPIDFHATQTPISGDVSPSLGSSMYAGVHTQMAVRRLTPVECERLQGFPDNYTNIRADCPDGPRYKALGNSMAVPVMRWIGERIAL
ncbi:MAG: DNA (cytosine-5-)-methyltransferase [Caulobacteraceae bacterium]|nr:DNA (cytosine-5-)-methyltransferase [Caulobacteraceae bacterium]